MRVERFILGVVGFFCKLKIFLVVEDFFVGQRFLRELRIFLGVESYFWELKYFVGIFPF